MPSAWKPQDLPMQHFLLQIVIQYTIYNKDFSYVWLYEILLLPVQRVDSEKGCFVFPDSWLLLLDFFGQWFTKVYVIAKGSTSRFSET